VLAWACLLERRSCLSPIGFCFALPSIHWFSLINQARRILIGPSSFGLVDVAPVERLRDAGFDVQLNPFGRKLTEQELIALLPGVVGLVAGLEPLNESVLQQSELRAISRSGVGMSNVDLDAARRLGIAVRNTPDAPTAAVAELTLGAMLALLRQIVPMSIELHAGRWTRYPGAQLEGRTVVVVGLGRVGRRVAALLLAFGANVIAVDPHVSTVEPPIELLSLGEALSRADIVTVHASGEHTILGQTELVLLKPGAIVLNCGRGGLVDEEALCAALDSGRVTGAWIDAFGSEPYSGPLAGYSQALLTPHVGSFTVECRRRMEMEAVENLLDALGSGGGEQDPLAT
jgi:D-3-phosphoglycerate dehydrogenase / 2-oxoglutarate reductase